MKKFRKIMAVLVAVMMVMAMCVPAWAATTKKVITIEYYPGAGGIQGSETAVPITETVEIPSNSKYVLYSLKPVKSVGFEKAADANPDLIGWQSANDGGTQYTDRILIDDEATSPIKIYGKWGKVSTIQGNNTALNDNTGNITIKNGVPGEKYNAYQLFELYSWYDENAMADEHTPGSEAYAYYIRSDHPLVASGWLSKVNADGTLPTEREEANAAFVLLNDQAITVNFGTVEEPVNRTMIPVKVTNKFMTRADENDDTEFQNPTNSTVQKFAQALLAQLKSVTGADDIAKLYTAGPKTANADGVAEFTGLPLGVYVVDSTLGSLCSLDTVSRAVIMADKNELASIEKKVIENGSAGEAVVLKGDKNDADFGETVTFESVVKLPLSDAEVIYHDNMSTDAFELTGISVSGIDKSKYTIYTKTSMSLANSVTSTAFDTEDDDNDAETPKVNVEPYRDATYGDDTFAIKFNAGWTAAETEVTITYTATLKTTATVGEQTGAAGSGNDNIAWITYGEAHKSAYDWTRTYTWDYDIFKYANYEDLTGVANAYKADTEYKISDGVYDHVTAHAAGYIRNGSETGAKYWKKVKPLSGAVFNVDRITTTSGTPSTSHLEFVMLDPADASRTPLDSSDVAVTKTGYYRLAVAGDTLKTTDLVSPASGVITIEGIDASDLYGNTTSQYKVIEKTAPTGYFKLANDITAVLQSNTKTQELLGDNNAKQDDNSIELFINGGNTAVADIMVENQTSREMPQTGGMGTTVLYIVGGMLVILAGAYLFFSRKRTA